MKKLLGLILLAVWSTPLWADVPKLLNYQGRLTKANNEAVANGDYMVRFRLYISETEANSVWEETQTINTQDGYFHTLLGQVNALTPSLFNQLLWLGIQVQAEAEMTPRQQLASSPAALTVSDGAITPSKIENNAVSKEKIDANTWQQILPIGTILPWHPNITNPPLPFPDGFAECNGQTLVATGGPLDGVVLPDLNNMQRFLRGSDHSGDMQDDIFQGHSHLVCYGNYPGPGSTTALLAEMDETPLQDHYSARVAATAETIVEQGCGQPRLGNETRPINMSVVWIMKIK